jgi:glycosyltransferase involved in cell wall biosynthesis
MKRVEGGKRIKGKTLLIDREGFPVISIITVVLNNRIFLEKTIKSIISQTYPHIESIIIDGCSSDGTLELIRAYDDKISYWLSEKDNGIYDAMNKGLSCATGDYVWFINAGDQINGPDTLQAIIGNDPSIDVYYGDTMLIDKDENFLGMRRLRPPEKLSWKSLGMGLVVCHQAILIKRQLAGRYNLKYHIAADFDWVMNALKKSSNILNTEIVMIRYLQEGFSRHHVALALKERFIIMQKNYGIIRTLYFHFCITVRLVIFFARKKLMPIFGSAEPANSK